MKRIFCLTLILSFCFNIAMAVVADTKEKTIQQSDGKPLTFFLMGDEHVSWAKTIDGYTLFNMDKGFVYALNDGKGGIKASEILAHDPEFRDEKEKEFLQSVEKNLFYSKEQISLMKQFHAAKQDFSEKTKSIARQEAYPQAREYKMVVILMSYADLEFSTPRQDIENLFNQAGYNANGHMGSVKDYFLASTFGQLNVSATVVGPYTADSNMAYYGQNTNYYGYYIKDIHSRDLIRQAITKADNDVDFSQFVNEEGSNQVSCVYVLYAGFAESSGNDANTIWPHRGQIYPPANLDGVQISDYGCSSEFTGYNSYYTRGPLKIGTICHEFSHVLGQPDYYDTDYDRTAEGDVEAFTPGSWDIMAHGNYNNNELTPPLWSAKERTVGNFIRLDTIELNSANTLPPLHKENKAFLINYPGTGEYLILENRQQTGWDEYLPGHGMLIFRVDNSVLGWNNNCVNCNATDLGYAIIPSDSSYSTTSGQYAYNQRQPFPGSTDNHSFTNTTNPSSQSKNGVLCDRPIYRIYENANTGNITFYCGDTLSTVNIIDFNYTYLADTLRLNAKVQFPQNGNITQKGFCYSLNNENTDINDNVFTDNSSSATAIEIKTDQLASNTSYYVRPFVKYGQNISYGEILKIKTPCDYISDFPQEISFEDGGTLCWQQDNPEFINFKWEYINEYSENGYQIQPHSGDTFAFIQSKSASAQRYKRKLITAAVNTTALDVPVLKYWYSQKSNSGRQDTLKVYYRTSLSQNWQLLKTYSNNVSVWQKDSVLLPDKSKTCYIAFEACLNGGFGVALDDVEITDNSPASWPEILTVGTENIIDTNVVLKANILSSGYTDITEKGFVLSLYPNPDLSQTQAQILKVSSYDSQIGEYSLTSPQLLPSTTYYYRAFAMNNGLISYGEQMTFTTLCERVKQYPYAPVISSADTVCFTNLGGWSAEENSNKYTFRSQTQGFNSMLILPIFDLSHKDSMSLSFDFAQLSSVNTDVLNIYYRRDIADSWTLIKTINSADNYRDSVILPTQEFQNSFINLAFEGISRNGGLEISNISLKAVSQIPNITTDTVYLTAYNSMTAIATLYGQGMDNITRKGFCYSLDENPTITNQVSVYSGNDTHFTCQINNLLPEKTYYVRAFATNSYGTAYGSQYVIQTPATPIFNNNISSDQRYCSSTVPEQLTGTSPSGGNGSFNYLWICSSDSINWIPCDEGSTNTNRNYAPMRISQTKYYRRIVYSGQTVDTSNIVTVYIDLISRGGNVFPFADTVMQNQEMIVEVSGHRGDILYWEIQLPGYDWQYADSSEAHKYLAYTSDIVGDHFFRAIIKNGMCDEVKSAEKSVYVKEFVGIDNIENKFEINISPNPSGGIIFVNTTSPVSQNISLFVTDINGKAVYQTEFALNNGANVLDLSGLENGIYTLNIHSKEIKFSEKIIISK